MNSLTFQIDNLSQDEINASIAERQAKMEAMIDCLYATTDAFIQLDRNTIYELIGILHETRNEIKTLRHQLL
jgi:uncharacterized coiled-coil protein SlyX